jgi:hypothetical protein
MVVLLSDVLAKSVNQSKLAGESERPLLAEDEIKSAIVSSVNYNLDNTPPDAASALRIFATRRQNTWLVATPNRLYCILDDVRKPSAHINWSMGRDQLLDGNRNLTIEIKSRSKSDRSGLVDIGPKHKNWYFSKSLFQSQPIEDAIRHMILAKM